MRQIDENSHFRQNRSIYQILHQHNSLLIIQIQVKALLKKQNKKPFQNKIHTPSLCLTSTFFTALSGSNAISGIQIQQNSTISTKQQNEQIQNQIRVPPQMQKGRITKSKTGYSNP